MQSMIDTVRIENQILAQNNIATAITSVAPIENRMIAMLYCVYTHERLGTFDDLIRNAPLAHADFVF